MSVELIDEIHMLRLALRRLTEDAALRARLGAAARRYWGAQATMSVMARDYESALATARALPEPTKPAGWPAHLTADGSSTARALLAQFGRPYPLDGHPAAGPGVGACRREDAEGRAGS